MVLMTMMYHIRRLSRFEHIREIGSIEINYDRSTNYGRQNDIENEEIKTGIFSLLHLFLISNGAMAGPSSVIDAVHDVCSSKERMCPVRFRHGGWLPNGDSLLPLPFTLYAVPYEPGGITPEHVLHLVARDAAVGESHDNHIICRLQATVIDAKLRSLLSGGSVLPSSAPFFRPLLPAVNLPERRSRHMRDPDLPTLCTGGCLPLDSPEQPRFLYAGPCGEKAVVCFFTQPQSLRVLDFSGLTGLTFDLQKNPISAWKGASPPSAICISTLYRFIARLAGEAIGISAAQHPRLSWYGYQTNSFPHMIRTRPYPSLNVILRKGSSSVAQLGTYLHSTSKARKKMMERAGREHENSKETPYATPDANNHVISIRSSSHITNNPFYGKLVIDGFGGCLPGLPSGLTQMVFAFFLSQPHLEQDKPFAAVLFPKEFSQGYRFSRQTCCFPVEFMKCKDCTRAKREPDGRDRRRAAPRLSCGQYLETHDATRRTGMRASGPWLESLNCMQLRWLSKTRNKTHFRKPRDVDGPRKRETGNPRLGRESERHGFVRRPTKQFRLNFFLLCLCLLCPLRGSTSFSLRRGPTTSPSRQSPRRARERGVRGTADRLHPDANFFFSHFSQPFLFSLGGSPYGYFTLLFLLRRSPGFVRPTGYGMSGLKMAVSAGRPAGEWAGGSVDTSFVLPRLRGLSRERLADYLMEYSVSVHRFRRGPINNKSPELFRFSVLGRVRYHHEGGQSVCELLHLIVLDMFHDISVKESGIRLLKMLNPRYCSILYTLSSSYLFSHGKNNSANDAIPIPRSSKISKKSPLALAPQGQTAASFPMRDDSTAEKKMRAISVRSGPHEDPYDSPMTSASSTRVPLPLWNGLGLRAKQRQRTIFPGFRGRTIIMHDDVFSPLVEDRHSKRRQLSQRNEAKGSGEKKMSRGFFFAFGPAFSSYPRRTRKGPFFALGHRKRRSKAEAEAGAAACALEVHETVACSPSVAEECGVPHTPIAGCGRREKAELIIPPSMWSEEL
ncbi:hypothetical protein CCUS01_02750 [Colletotrichum cuscutae]|uniref:Uncharacterized protein n=1 Tax=Colletotrichum cuscutae TaxID=1209917 RepID=A0AAI9YBZ7_9PEZI|nr:hypothetical protein CCUS01_02750 [Colletotrichum cuscutae]